MIPLLGSAGFDAVILAVPHDSRVGEKLSHPLIRRALDNAKYVGIAVVWMPHLWCDWPDACEPKPDVSEWLDPVHYMLAIERSNAERDAIRAAWGIEVYSALDAEPYGQTAVKPRIHSADGKAVFMTPEQMGAMRWAIERAIERVGRVDYVTPVDSDSPKRYVWAVALLGTNRLNQNCYLYKAADPFPVLKTPWEPWVLGVRGVRMGATLISVAEYRAIQALGPPTWVYVAGDAELAATVKAMVGP